MCSFLVYNRVNRLEIQSVKVKTACGWGGGVVSSVGDHLLQEFNSLFLTIFRTY
jgi:hypothetical protein